MPPPTRPKPMKTRAIGFSEIIFNAVVKQVPTSCKHELIVTVAFAAPSPKVQHSFHKDYI